MSGSASLRNAFIVHGLALAILGGSVLAEFFGAGDITADTFAALAKIVAVVLCLWSLVLSIRGVLNGAKWWWAGVIWGVVALELLVPSIFYWSHAEDNSNLENGLLLGVLLPLAAISGLFFAGTAALFRISTHRRVIIGLAAVLFLPILILIMPGAAYLVTVLSTKITTAYRLSTASLDRDAENDIARAMIERCPEFIRDNVDRCLAIQHSGKLYKYHLCLCNRGLLSRTRSLEILVSPNTSDSFPDPCHVTWWGLKENRPDLAVSIAVDIALGKVKTTEGIVFDAPVLSLRVSNFENELNRFVAEKASQEQIREILCHFQTCPLESKEDMLIYLRQQQRIDCWAMIERLVIRRQCTDPAVIHLVTDIIARPTAEGRFLKHKRWTLDDWSTAKRASGKEKLDALKELLEYCRSESDLYLRRLAATALSDVLKIDVNHTPFADDLTNDGKPVPVTLDESEEIEQLCNAAQAEIDKASDSLKH